MGTQRGMQSRACFDPQRRHDSLIYKYRIYICPIFRLTRLLHRVKRC